MADSTENPDEKLRVRAGVIDAQLGALPHAFDQGETPNTVQQAGVELIRIADHAHIPEELRASAHHFLAAALEQIENGDYEEAAFLQRRAVDELSEGFLVAINSDFASAEAQDRSSGDALSAVELQNSQQEIGAEAQERTVQVVADMQALEPEKPAPRAQKLIAAGDPSTAETPEEREKRIDQEARSEKISQIIAERGAGDYYTLLGVKRSATEAEIKKAYRDLARLCHPDKNKGDATTNGLFKQVSEAFAVLVDPEKRAQYDRLGKEAFDPVDWGADYFEQLRREVEKSKELRDRIRRDPRPPHRYSLTDKGGKVISAQYVWISVVGRNIYAEDEAGIEYRLSEDGQASPLPGGWVEDSLSSMPGGTAPGEDVPNSGRPMPEGERDLRPEALEKLEDLRKRFETQFDLLAAGKKNSKTREATGKINATFRSLRELAEKFAKGDQGAEVAIHEAEMMFRQDPESAPKFVYNAIDTMRIAILAPTEEERRVAAEALLVGPLADIEAKYPNLDAKPEYFVNVPEAQLAGVPGRIQEIIIEVRVALKTNARFRELRLIMSGEGTTVIDFTDQEARINIFEAPSIDIAEKIKTAFEDRAEAIDNLEGIKELVENSRFRTEHLAQFATRIAEFEGLLAKPPKGVSYKELDARLDAFAEEVDTLEDELQQTPARLGERIGDLRAAYPKFNIEPLVRGFPPEDQRTKLDELEVLIPAVAAEVDFQGIDLTVLSGDVLFVHGDAEPSIRCHVQGKGKSTIFTPNELVVPFSAKDPRVVVGKLSNIYEKFIRITQDSSFIYPGTRYEADFSELAGEIKLSTETSIERERKQIDATMAILGLAKDDLAVLDLDLVFTKNPPLQKRGKDGKPIPGNPEKDTLYLDLRKDSAETMASQIFEARKAKVMEVRLRRISEEYPNFGTDPKPENYKPETLKRSGVSAELLAKVEAMLDNLRQELGSRFLSAVKFTLELEGASRRGRSEALELAGDAKQWNDGFMKQTTEKIIDTAKAKEDQLADFRIFYPRTNFHLDALNTFDEQQRSDADANIRTKLSAIGSQLPNFRYLPLTFEDGFHVGFKGEALRVGFDGTPTAVARRIQEAEDHSKRVLDAKTEAAAFMGQYPVLKIDLGFDDDMEVKGVPQQSFPPALFMIKTKAFLDDFARLWPPGELEKFPLVIRAEGKERIKHLGNGAYELNIALAGDAATTSREILQRIVDDRKKEADRLAAEARELDEDKDIKAAEEAFKVAERGLLWLREYVPRQGKNPLSKEKTFDEIEALGREYVTSLKKRPQTQAEMWTALERDVRAWLGPMPNPPAGRPGAATVLMTYFRAYFTYVAEYESKKGPLQGVWQAAQAQQQRAAPGARHVRPPNTPPGFRAPGAPPGGRTPSPDQPLRPEEAEKTREWKKLQRMLPQAYLVSVDELYDPDPHVRMEIVEKVERIIELLKNHARASRGLTDIRLERFAVEFYSATNTTEIDENSVFHIGLNGTPEEITEGIIMAFSRTSGPEAAATQQEINWESLPEARSLSNARTAYARTQAMLRKWQDALPVEEERRVSAVLRDRSIASGAERRNLEDQIPSQGRDLLEREEEAENNYFRAQARLQRSALEAQRELLERRGLAGRQLEDELGRFEQNLRRIFNVAGEEGTRLGDEYRAFLRQP